MTVSVHAISWSSRAAGEAPHGLRWVIADELAAAVSPAVEPEDVLERAQQLAQLHDAGTILPVQSGAELPSEAAVAAWLTAHRDELTEALNVVEGAVELGVRSAGTPDPPLGTGGGPGAAYLGRRLAERAEARRLAQRLAPLGPLAIAGPLVDAERGSASAGFLVAREEVPRFVATLADLEAATEGPALVCTGPWPPYSFTAPLPSPTASPSGTAA